MTGAAVLSVDWGGGGVVIVRLTRLHYFFSSVVVIGDRKRFSSSCRFSGDADCKLDGGEPGAVSIGISFTGAGEVFLVVAWWCCFMMRKVT